MLIQLGEHQKAKQLIERSINLNPEKDGQKYLNLAEMLTGAEAVQMYLKGIKVLQGDHSRFQQSLNSGQEAHTLRQMASAHASIAESYMTEPLCDDSDAEN